MSFPRPFAAADRSAPAKLAEELRGLRRLAADRRAASAALFRKAIKQFASPPRIKPQHSKPVPA